MWIFVLFVTGSRDSDEEIEFHTDIGLYNGFTVCGFSRPGTQGGIEAPVQEFMGGSTSMAQPLRAKIKNLRF